MKRTGVLAALAALVLAAAWQVGPLKTYLDLDVLESMLRSARASGWLFPAIVLIFVVGGLLMLPLTVLLVGLGVLLPPAEAYLAASLGCLASAAVTYWAGRLFSARLGAHPALAMARERVDAEGAKGLLAVAGIRWVPLAHFSLVNAALGASGYRFGRFMLSTAAGMAPIVAVTVGVAGGARRVWLEPSNALLILWGGGLFALVGLVLFVLRRSRRSSSGSPGS